MKKVYNKLVRDKMIDIYKHDVANAITARDFSARFLKEREMLAVLKNKLLEETSEVCESCDQNDIRVLKEELADLLEVIDAILHHKGITLPEVLEVKEQKKEKRGGFEKGLFLESIDYLD